MSISFCSLLASGGFVEWELNGGMVVSKLLFRCHDSMYVISIKYVLL